MKKILSILFLIFIIGCQQSPQPQQTFIKQSSEIEKINQKVKKAFDNANDLEEKHSKWYDRNEKLPLTIIAVAYIDPEVKNTKEFYAYKKLIKEIQNNPNLLPDDLRKLYSSIKFIDYDKSNLASEKFNAAYTHRYDDKEVLNDIIRPDNEHPSQELLIRLNYNELKKGNLVIEGYKTVKQKNKLRNSYYFTLRYPSYSKLSKKDKNRVIINSLFVVLSLSIPEYVSIDMNKIIDKNKLIKILKQNSDRNTYKGKIWKYEVNNEIDKLKDKIKNLEVKSLMKVLDGHTSTVNSVAFSPDGRYALSGSYDKTLRYWDLKTGETIKVLKGHIDSVKSVAISPDGRYALSGSWDKTLRYWDLKTGKTIKVLKGHTGWVSSIAFSPDGKYALSSNSDILTYWDLKTGKTIKVLKGHTSWVSSVAISPNGKYALSGSKDKTLRYWNLKTGKTFKVLKGHKNGVMSVAISPDGRYALSGSWDKTLRYWDLKTGKTIKVLKGHTSWVSSVAISPNGKYALSSGIDNTIKYWNLGKIDKINKLKNQINKIKDLAALREQKLMLTILTTPFKENNLDILYRYGYLYNKGLNIKNISKISNTLNYSFSNPIVAIALPVYKNNINKDITFYKNKAVLIPYKDEYDLDNLYFTSKLNYQEIGYKNIYDKTLTLIESKVLKGHTKNVTSAVISPDGRYALSGSADNTLRYWDLKNGKTIRVLKGHIKSVTSVAISPDGKYALSGSDDNTLRYWNLKTGKIIKILKGHIKGITSIMISPNGKYALSGSWDKTLRYWDLKTGKTVKLLKGHNWGIDSVTISPDGKYALSGSYDGVIRYWNLKTGEILKVLKSNNWGVNLVIFNPDGKYILSSSGNKIRYWKLNTNKTITILKGHTNTINSIAFSPDSKYALSGSSDKTVRYWNLGLEEFLNIL